MMKHNDGFRMFMYKDVLLARAFVRGGSVNGQFQDKSPRHGNGTISDFAVIWCIWLSLALISIFELLKLSLHCSTGYRLTKIKLNVKYHYTFSIVRAKVVFIFID